MLALPTPREGESSVTSFAYSLLFVHTPTSPGPSLLLKREEAAHGKWKDIIASGTTPAHEIREREEEERGGIIVFPPSLLTPQKKVPSSPKQESGGGGC